MTNLPQRLKVKVTPGNLANGKRKCKRKCPLALAIINALKMQNIVVLVYTTEVIIYKYSTSKLQHAFLYALPLEATKFIRTYDDGEQLPSLPITFHLAQEEV